MMCRPGDESAAIVHKKLAVVNLGPFDGRPSFLLHGFKRLQRRCGFGVCTANPKLWTETNTTVWVAGIR
eukprot:1150376-Amphidinium_carterae.1